MKYILMIYFLFFQLAWADVDRMDMWYHQPSKTVYLGDGLCVHPDARESLCIPNAFSKYSHEVVDSVPQETWVAFQEQAREAERRVILTEPLPQETLDILFHKPSQTKYLGEDLCVRHDTEEYLCLPNAVSKYSREVMDSIPQETWAAFQEQVSQADYRVVR